jgi:hypothetical protein
MGLWREKREESGEAQENKAEDERVMKLDLSLGHYYESFAFD